jgi:hypothetical protein
MDWIKVKTNHILHEYTDLKDSEFAAWIKIMALTATLEREPTREQILKHVNYQTLDSLSRRLHEHSIDLPYILHKVLIDVSYVAHRREALKINTQRFRERNKPVINDVIITSSIREDKIREDKNIKKGFVVPTIGEITSYCLERKNAVNPETWLNHYTSNGWMVGKNKMKDWKASVRTWEAKDGRGHDSKRGFGIQAEYKEQRPELSEEQRRANVERARELAGKIGGVPGKV